MNMCIEYTCSILRMGRIEKGRQVALPPFSDMSRLYSTDRAIKRGFPSRRISSKIDLRPSSRAAVTRA